MTTAYKPYSLAYDPETTRPGERVHAEPDPVGDDFARRLRDVERAGRLRNTLYSAAFGAGECAHFARHTLRDPARAARFERERDFFLTLFEKVCRIEARARGEASDV